MPLPGKTVGEQLALLEEMLPKRSANGHLWSPNSEHPQRATNGATMYLYLVSNEKQYSVHETEYVSRKSARTPTEWAAWFKRHAFKGSKSEGTPYEVLGIIKGNIIPAVNLRTGTQWKVKAYLGFRTHDISRSYRAEMDRDRHKTKPQRRKNGKNHLRRRHGNRKRKA